MKTSRIFALGIISLLSVTGTGESQTSVRDVRRVRWPLIDFVLASDSVSGVLLLTAPNPRTVQWEKGSSVIDLRLDPVYALQWATRARDLLREDSAATAAKATRVAPALRPRAHRKLLLLARRAKGPAEEQFILVLSDSGSKTHWRTFAGRAHVESLLTALEQTGTSAWAIRGGVDSMPADSSDDFDQPVSVVSQPQPRYPASLAMRGRIGRVWMMYAVGPDGRVEPGSFQPLLSDDSLFTKSAIEALARSKFRPARRDGRPVRQRVFQVITFLQR